MTRRAAPDDDEVLDVAPHTPFVARRAAVSEPEPTIPHMRPRRAAPADEPEPHDRDDDHDRSTMRHQPSPTKASQTSAPVGDVAHPSIPSTVTTPQGSPELLITGMHAAESAPPDRAAPSETRPARGRGPRWMVLVAVLVVALVAAGVIHRLGAADRQRVRIATDTVTNYLSSVSHGDAATATGLLITEGVDVSLLTDEVLAMSTATAALSDIAVTDVTSSQDDTTVQVSVSYRLGGTQVDTTMEVVVAGDEGRVRGAGTIDLSGVTALNPRVNGVSAASDHPVVFPGSYQVTIDNPYLETASSTQLITGADTAVTTVDLNLVATRAGIEMFRQEVSEAVQACLASKALDPGCGAALPTTLSGGETVVDGTVSRSLSATDQASLAELVPEPDPSRPTVLTVSSAKLGTLVLEADVRTSTRTVRATLEGYGQGFGFARATIDVTDPSLPIVWG